MVETVESVQNYLAVLMSERTNHKVEDTDDGSLQQHFQDPCSLAGWSGSAGSFLRRTTNADVEKELPSISNHNFVLHLSQQDSTKHFLLHSFGSIGSLLLAPSRVD